MSLRELLEDKITENTTVADILELAKDIDINSESNVEELTNLKRLLDKANSEASSYKKKLRETLSEKERAEEDRKQEQEELKANYEALLKKTTISEHTAKFLALGYDEKSAQKSAEALYEGNLDVVFNNMKSYNDNLEKRIKTEILKETPRPEGGQSKDVAMTLDKLKAMSQEDRLKFANENPQEYKNLYLGG